MYEAWPRFEQNSNCKPQSASLFNSAKHIVINTPVISKAPTQRVGRRLYPSQSICDRFRSRGSAELRGERGGSKPSSAAIEMGCAVRVALAAALAVLLVVQLVQPASALNFKIAPKEELCFHEITHKGNKVLAFFDVLSWGYGAYVYLYVKSPTGTEIQKFEAESEGRVEFTASTDGEHSFCFKNAYTETEVSFWVNTETDVALADVAKEGRFLWNDHCYYCVRDCRHW